ncbi:MAG: AAA family ATPase, partial [Anaerolineae bacterium]|nr:AAA family ATPase [Anaerolineae bacterium]
MIIHEIIAATLELVKNTAVEFGGKITEDQSEPNDFVFRNNTKPDALKNGGAYFGVINGTEEFSGRYHDLSVVIFPASEVNQSWVISLGVGTLGFKDDYELASLPGLRRRYLAILSEKGFAKTSLVDIEKGLPKAFRDTIPHLQKTFKTYSNMLPICDVIEDPMSEEGINTIRAFLAVFAEFKAWASNNAQRTAIQKAIQRSTREKSVNERKEVLDLLLARKFLILQGAPGTGKTFLAGRIAEKFDQTFFTQFHAETSYSEFIFGIYPSLSGDDVQYKGKQGVFLEALSYAIEHPSETVLLIIDEINRANLSNVLGPVFYLFEYGAEKRELELRINLVEDMSLTALPQNFYVIATMNTADRSLAVVDFALRRRFAWYTMYPHDLSKVDLHSGQEFFAEYFLKMHSIFQRFAENADLALEPGHSYYLA